MELMDAVRARRSVRRFEAREIPDEILADILDAGRQAPSSGGIECCVFGVIKDGPTKAALAKAAGGQEWVAGAPVVIAHCAWLGADLATAGEDDFRVAVNKDRFGTDLVSYLNAYHDRDAMRVLLENSSPLIPGEHVVLAAASHGLGSCWVGHLDTRAASRILGLPDGLVCLFLTPIGYPAEEPGPKSVRPAEDCVFYDHWE
ncbi:nitroreductase family protein [Streptomyces sp. YIM S03343]